MRRVTEVFALPRKNFPMGARWRAARRLECRVYRRLQVVSVGSDLAFQSGRETRMPRMIWNGHITFGLVSIPVALYPAESREELDFTLAAPSAVAPRSAYAGRGVTVRIGLVTPSAGGHDALDAVGVVDPVLGAGNGALLMLEDEPVGIDPAEFARDEVVDLFAHFRIHRRVREDYVRVHASRSRYHPEAPEEMAPVALRHVMYGAAGIDEVKSSRYRQIEH